MTGRVRLERRLEETFAGRVLNVRGCAVSESRSERLVRGDRHLKDTLAGLSRISKSVLGGGLVIAIEHTDPSSSASPDRRAAASG
jgi:hypothetical protein